MKIPEATEHQIQDSILGWLRYHGYYAMRMNSGRVPVVNKYGQRHMMALMEAGTPDIMAYRELETGVEGGVKLFFIEVKRPKNKPTILQQAKMEELSEYGARCFVATSIEDVEEQLT